MRRLALLSIKPSYETLVPKDSVIMRTNMWKHEPWKGQEDFAHISFSQHVPLASTIHTTVLWLGN
jgi:hypothetical protein